MKPLALAVLAAVAVFAQPSGTVIDPDAYAVYNVIVPSTALIQGFQATELLIQDTTPVDDPLFKQFFPSGRGLIGPWQEAVTNFKAANSKPQLLMAQFSLPVPYRLETKNTIEGWFAGVGTSGWDAFHAAYPNAKGFLQVSAVGFDETHEHAIVYMAHSCDGGCAEQMFHFLQHSDNGWQEVRLDVNNCHGMA